MESRSFGFSSASRVWKQKKWPHYKARPQIKEVNHEVSFYCLDEQDTDLFQKTKEASNLLPASGYKEHQHFQVLKKSDCKRKYGDRENSRSHRSRACDLFLKRRWDRETGGQLNFRYPVNKQHWINI
ncbi:MAG: hypothetical protein AB8B55_17780 [Mariniblastus sp.]